MGGGKVLSIKGENSRKRYSDFLQMKISLNEIFICFTRNRIYIKSSHREGNFLLHGGETKNGVTEE
jgi:hypothetical protein